MNTDWERNSDIHLQIVLQRAVKKIDGKIERIFEKKVLQVRSLAF